MTSHEFWMSFALACREIHAGLDLERTEKAIVKCAAELFGAMGAAVMLFDPGDGSLKISAAHGLSDEYLAKGPISPDRSLQDTVLRSAVVVTDVSTDSKVQYREAAAKEGIHSIVGLPLTGGGMLTGSLRLYFDRKTDFSPQRMEAMGAMAEQASLALNIRLFFASLKKSLEIHTMPSLYSFDQTILKLVEAAARSVGAKGCALWLVDRDAGALKLAQGFGLSKSYLDKGPVSLERSLGEVDKGEPVVISCIAEDDRVQYPEQAERENIRALVGFPVMAGGRASGALRFYFHFEFQPDDDDLALMAIMVAHVGSALEKNQLMIKLKADSDRYHDLLEDMEGGFYRA